MSKVTYTAAPQGFSWRYLVPWCIIKDLSKFREMIVSITIRDFRAAYQASYLGIAWQAILPIIMLSIFYFVFGEIFGGRFLNTGKESSIDYALALFVGLGFFNFLAQNIGSAPSLITSNLTYVKTLSFPLEILSITTVLNALLNLAISMLLTIAVLLLVNGFVHFSAVCTPFYMLCTFLIAIGVSWGLSALAVFIRDVNAFTSPLTLILMFMCPIFYPMSMVPEKVKWVININPLAIIIEDVRACMLYGKWPSLGSMASVFVVSLLFSIFGYYFFMRSKSAFADVI